MVRRDVRLMLCAAAGAMALGGVMVTACAQEPATTIEIAAQPLDQALLALSRQANVDITASASVTSGRTANAVRGRMNVEAALATLLRGTGLVARKTGARSYTVVLVTGSRDIGGEQAEITDAEIVVTGSRIRGAPIASPVISQSDEEMRSAGHNTLADAIRAIPQNFGGGQNPGVGLNVPANSGQRLGSGTSINLRGLGQDATLTLLNGHRLSYNSSRQGIDISTIPLSAVSRIEIVADGASALYGSDAVAGVANVVLKRDFDGLMTSARFGASTDGGNEQQQYELTVGEKWATGGFIAAYEFERDTPIVARQRSYAAESSPGLTLFPSNRRHAVVLSGHQSISPVISFQVDALYNKRWSEYGYALTDAGQVQENGAMHFSKSEAFAIAPSLEWNFSEGWRAFLSGMYGEDRTRYGSDTYIDGTIMFPTRGCYCNQAQSVELGADGPLFDLPGGSSRLAIGGGYRSNDFHGFRTIGTSQDVRASQDAYYAYAELSLPLVSPSMALSGVNRLNLSGAIRYEKYPGVDNVATPKIGLIYSPFAGFEAKLSWGKSFRAPTLFQQYNTQAATLRTAMSRGGTGFPPTSTVIELTGGNPVLKPERATTWAVTLVVQPPSVDRLKIEVSYFDIDYKDRIVAPITVAAQALSNPIYNDLVKRQPTDEEKENAITNAGAFFNNLGRPYNPADVVAIIHNINSNAARQRVKGVDALFRYGIDFGDHGLLNLSANGTYVRSTQRLSSLQPILNLAGNIFNPPHFRGRASAVWSVGALTVTTSLNHISGVKDNRATSNEHIKGMTTIDVVGRYEVTSGIAMFDGMEVFLSLQNILNDKPSAIKTVSVFESPYDSTNYSPIGRFISLGIKKKW